MALTSGTRLGPYEIQSPLGAGGMGEVYRARDTRLDRIVAIKILPSHLSENPEAKQRFDREARTISSLNHPNICTLHDVGHQDGVDYLVMEYLEGETLADRLRKGPLPVRAGLEIRNRNLRRTRESTSQRSGSPRSEAWQHHADQNRREADGLRSGEGAPWRRTDAIVEPDGDDVHAGGKPSADGAGHRGGHVPVHGARAGGRQRSRRALRHLRAGRSAVRNGDGEACVRGQDGGQCDGGGAGARSAPISSVQPMAPAALDHVVQGCLAKDPEARWQNAADIARELRWIASGGSSIGAPPPVHVVPRWRERLAWVAVVVALLVGLAWMMLREQSRSERCARSCLHPRR